jgi:hypothetical protein
MSYLDVPRLHFAGGFTADPSTINNTIANYDPANLGQLNLSWNPYGSHAWTISASVRSFVDAGGNVHRQGDPLLGAACENYAPKVPAKLVDLDTDQQARTRLYGPNIQIVTAAGDSGTTGGTGGAASTVLLQGHFADAATLLNLWLSRVPAYKGDTAAGGAFQSVLEQLDWRPGSSPLLQQLHDASPDGLSIRISCYGYIDAHVAPGFQEGKIVGTIGPWRPGEPRFNVFDRFLNPAGGSSLWYAPAKLDAGRATVTFDLGNSVPEQTPGGIPVALGPMQAAILMPGGAAPVVLGDVDYSQAALESTAGVAQVGGLTPQQVQQAAANPLGILTAGTPALAESPGGLYVEVDGATLYMNPDDTATATLYAATYGQRTPGYAAALSLVPQFDPNGLPINNYPPAAISFPASVVTDASGRAEIPLAARNPVPKTRRREFVDGQLYFLGGPWSSGADQVPGAPLTVKIFNSVEPPVSNPTWTDVAPILYQYYFLYAYMAGIVDLSQYDSVKANASGIQKVLELPDSDPNYMPVTREMSRGQRQLILSWIQLGCPR